MAYLALIVEDVVIKKWPIVEDVIIIGRAKDCDIEIDDQSVSSKHARLVVEADPYLDDTSATYVEDLRSTNGTELNGKKIKRERLKDQDILKFGFNQFRYISDEQTNLDETAVIVN